MGPGLPAWWVSSATPLHGKFVAAAGRNPSYRAKVDYIRMLCREDMRRIYREILKTAELYRIVISIEPHGYFTPKPEFMEEMLSFSDRPISR